MLVAGALRPLSLTFCPAQRRQKQGSQDCDNGNDDQQFHQRKSQRRHSPGG